MKRRYFRPCLVFFTIIEKQKIPDWDTVEQAVGQAAGQAAGQAEGSYGTG
jgi:hypothetical protein